MTNKFIRKHNLLFIVFIGLFLSIVNAIWAFLLSIAETANGNFAFTALFMAFGLIPIPLALTLINGDKIKLSVYAILTGLTFGIANAILLSIFTYKDSAIIYSLISPTIIIFILLEVIVNRKKVKRENRLKLIFGGVLAGLGVILLSFSGLNISLISPYDVAVSLILIFIYGLAGFLMTQTGLESNGKFSPIMIIGIFEVIAILFFLPVSWHNFSPNGLDIAFLAGLIVSIGVILSFLGYNSISSTKKAIPYSSIIYVLSEMETVFVLLFYSIFVMVLNFYAVGSIILIVVSVWYLSRESDLAFS